MGRTKVKLRKKKISDGRYSLYLDYYPPIRIPETMQMKRYEYLGMYIFVRPKTATQKEHNDVTLKQAETIWAIRQQAVVNEEFGFLDTERQNASFLDYFDKQAHKKGNSWLSAYNHFKRFVKGYCTFGQMNMDLCDKYREYILTAKQIRYPDRTLSHNTAANYFALFCKCLFYANRDKMIKEDLERFVEYIKPISTHRDFLVPSELMNLSKTPCDIPVLKRASLFACMTGLRVSDVRKLSWNEIIPNMDGTGFNVQLRMQKTKVEILIPISQEALMLCGWRKEGLVFDGFTKSMTGKPLKKWIKAAGITKPITFHCFRHTYAVLQLASGTSIYVVSRILGHKHVSTTEIYLDLLEETKIGTIDRIKIYIDPYLRAA